MNLVIHDLLPMEWEKVSEHYAGWHIISDQGSIKPCNGCFCCWSKTPGQCVLNDGYEHMGALLHAADEVHVISRYTYGGFSPFVKNVFDRSLSYVLPQFEVVNGETHHKKRYPEYKPFTFIFYGQEISEENKHNAHRYVNAVCANIRGTANAVLFRECQNSPVSIPDSQDESFGKVLLLNASMRSENGNSAKLARKLRSRISEESEIIDLKQYLNKPDELLGLLEHFSTIVLCMPLYVDGLPSQLLRFMETVQHKYHGSSKRIYVLANMGLYESKQLGNLFSSVSEWCNKMHFSYCGGLGISAGELIGVLMQHIPFKIGPTKTISKKMDQLASAISNRLLAGEMYAEPFCFPRFLYIFVANTNWNRIAKKNGIRPKDLYCQR